jgi:hypothetical protein
MIYDPMGATGADPDHSTTEQRYGSILKLKEDIKYVR